MNLFNININYDENGRFIIDLLEEDFKCFLDEYIKRMFSDFYFDI